jgi:protein SCO1/2
MPTEPIGSSEPDPPAALRWVVPLLVLPVLAAAVWFAITMMRAVPPAALDIGESGTVLRAPLPLPDFSLTDHTGQTFDASRFDGQWSFVFFGYTFCPDVCPMALGTFRSVDEILADQSDLQFIFVSVDPERDSLERLAEFVPYFHPDFIGVTGAPEELGRLTKTLGIYHQKSDTETGRDYLLDHSTSVLLIDPEHRLSAIFRTPHDPESIAAAFRKIRKHRGTP